MCHTTLLPAHKAESYVVQDKKAATECQNNNQHLKQILGVTSSEHRKFLFHTGEHSLRATKNVEMNALNLTRFHKCEGKKSATVTT